MNIDINIQTDASRDHIAFVLKSLAMSHKTQELDRNCISGGQS